MIRSLMALTVLIWSFDSYSQVIVESLEEGTHKGTVYIPPNISLKPGDTLFTHQPSVPEAKEPQKDPLPPPGPKNLRSRENNISVSYGETEAQVTLANTPKSTTSSKTLELAYGREFGYVQPFASFSSSVKESDQNTETSLKALEFGVRVNVIENLPGQNFVPYGAISYLRAELNQESAGVGFTASGDGFELEVGLTWYPLGEILGFQASFHSLDAKLEDGVSHVDIGGSSFMIGYVFSF